MNGQLLGEHIRYRRLDIPTPELESSRTYQLQRRGRWYYLNGKKWMSARAVYTRVSLTPRADRFDVVRDRLNAVVTLLRSRGLVTEVMSQVTGIEDDVQYIEIKLKVPATVFDDDEQLEPIYAELWGVASDAVSVLPSLYPERRASAQP